MVKKCAAAEKKVQKELITRMWWVEMHRVSCLPTCRRGDANEEWRETFAMGGGDGLAVSRESGGCRRWPGGVPHGEKIKALEMISLQHATRLLR